MKFQRQDQSIRAILSLAALSLLASIGGAQSARAQADTGCSATVYWDADLHGEAWTLHESTAFVGPHWNDQISSIVVHRGVWIFYWDADFKGEELKYGPGRYATIPARWNDQISSARCVEPGVAPDDAPREEIMSNPPEGEYIAPGEYGRPHDHHHDHEHGHHEPHEHGHHERPHHEPHHEPHHTPHVNPHGHPRPGQPHRPPPHHH